MNGHVTAIILAAGFSERMGEFKPLLPLGGITILERCVKLFMESGIGDVRVVTGHRSGELSPLLARLGVMAIENPRYREGMFSSVTAGLATIGSDVDSLFVLPVDIPLVRFATIRRLLQSFRGEEMDVVYPLFLGEPGHPPLISGRIAGDLLLWNGDGGLRGALEVWNDRSLDLEVADGGVLLDMDTPDDLCLLEKRAKRLEIPTVDECMALMERVIGVEKRIVRHGRAVARVAVRIGEKLLRAGCHLDLPLIEAAALLHDIAKGEPDHARVGARLLSEEGFATLAGPVACHMDMEFSVGDEIEAAQLLYLADKLVNGDRMVSLEERFGAKLMRYRNEPEILAGVNRRLDTARRVAERIERVLGRPLEEMLANTL